MIADVVTWPAVALALVTGLPAIIAAYYGHKNAHSLRTGNDKTVGSMVTDVHGEASKQKTGYDTHG